MTIIKNYLSLIKFSHTIFALPFAGIGFCIGLFRSSYSGRDLNVPIEFGWDESNVNWWRDSLIKLGLVILCMVFARSAAMAFNRYVDRDIDALNPRTAGREIPDGIIKAQNALAFTFISCILFIATTFFINKLCFYLSPVALAVILGYSYTKRFTPLSHLILGLGLSLAPIGAYIAVTGKFHLLPIFFSVAVLCWVSGFDIIYSLQDEEFDKKNKLYSLPAVFGKTKSLRISELLHLLCAMLLIAAGLYGNFDWLYWVGIIIFCAMLVYQHILVKPHDLSKINIAFMTTNGIASVVFAIFVIADILFN